jgi:hypothetical protein
LNWPALLLRLHGWVIGDGPIHPVVRSASLALAMHGAPCQPLGAETARPLVPGMTLGPAMNDDRFNDSPVMA